MTCDPIQRRLFYRSRTRANNVSQSARSFTFCVLDQSEWGLCKERKPKRPNPETTGNGNSRLITRITNNYIVDARSLEYHLDKYRPNVVSRKVVYYLTADNFVNYLIILLYIINFLNNAGFV
jgi:hypothetical protein